MIVSKKNLFSMSRFGGHCKRTVFLGSEHVMPAPIEIGRPSSRAVIYVRNVRVVSTTLRTKKSYKNTVRGHIPTHDYNIFDVQHIRHTTYSTYGIFLDPRRCCPYSRPRCRTASGALCNVRSRTGIRFLNT